MPSLVNAVHTRQFLWRRSISGSLIGRVFNNEETNLSRSQDFPR